MVRTCIKVRNAHSPSYPASSVVALAGEPAVSQTFPAMLPPLAETLDNSQKEVVLTLIGHPRDAPLRAIPGGAIFDA